MVLKTLLTVQFQLAVRRSHKQGLRYKLGQIGQTRLKAKIIRFESVFTQ